MIPETALAPRGRFVVRPLLLAFVGIPVLALLGFFWLEIPDSHVWQLAFSLLTGAVIVGAFLWITSSAIRALRNALLPCSHWLGALLLAFWMIVKWTLVHIVSRIDDHSMERAGFWNSKLSAGMRTTFTFDRMIAWQHDLVLLLLWIIIPVLLTPFFIETVSRGLRSSVWSSAAGVLKRWQHWLTVILCDVAIYWLTDKLTGWKPSHSVRGELISLAFRLTLCYLIDFALIVIILAVDSKLLAREHARRYPAAEPSANTA